MLYEVITAAAYGIAVTGTMVITSILISMVARHNWDWPGRLVKLITFGRNNFV